MVLPAHQNFNLISDKLAKRMVKESLITKEQLAVARVTRDYLGEDLGRILVKKGFITEDLLLSFIGSALEIPFMRLRDAVLQADVIHKIPSHLARKHHLIPLWKNGNEVVVAMSDPFNQMALDDLKRILHSNIKAVLASYENIENLIDQYYGQLRSPTSRKDDEAHDLAETISEDAVELGGDDLEKISSGSHVMQEVNQIIAEAFGEHASDIHIEPSHDGVRIRYRIDGLLEERDILERQMHHALVSRIKILGGLDIAERRIPQDGRFRLKIGGNTLDLRVATCPTLYGEKVVLRLLAKEGVIRLESLGFSELDLTLFSDLIERSHGIFLVTGPTGSGKSSTLYAALSRINSPEKNIISVEDPIESEILGINQTQIHPKAGLTFASALRSMLRQDPDVIMLGEIRDAETAQIASRAAITGHLVLSTLHTNTAAGAISRLVDLGVEPFLISSSLIGVLAQRLVRKICPECRAEAEPDERVRSLPIKLQHSFRGRGCASCRMTGYSGRIGIFELAPIRDAVRRIISGRGSDRDVEAEFRKMGVRPILEDGLGKVNQGITTIDEVLRVTEEES